MDGVGHGHSAGLEHRLVQLLLLHLLELFVQGDVVDGLPQVGARDGVGDLFAELVVFL